MFEYLTYDDVVEIHKVGITRFGGIHGVKEPGSVDFMASKPAMEAYGTELFPGLFMKAACYMEGFSTRQFFNERSLDDYLSDD